MKISLIISTYNWAQALKFVLDSAAQQSYLPDEVVVADDGSTEETAMLIEGLQSSYPTTLIHAWQVDKGFRAARSRNNGVAHSNGEYLIFIDGDTVLHRHFIKDHIALAKKRHFTVGSRVLISESATITAFEQCAFDFSFLKTKSDNKLNSIHLPSLAQYYAKSVREPIEQWIFKVRSCNMGVWRSDYEAVNGFNHDFQGWGREDSEFALRLFKKGLYMRRLKFAAIQYHLYHQENDRSQLLINDDLLQDALSRSDFKCRQGLSEL